MSLLSLGEPVSINTGGEGFCLQIVHSNSGYALIRFHCSISSVKNGKPTVICMTVSPSMVKSQK